MTLHVDARPPGAPRRAGRATPPRARRLARLDLEVSPYLLRLPVLPALRDLRALPARLHPLGLAARLGPARRRPGASSGSTTTASCSATRLLERGGQHVRHVRPVDRAAARSLALVLANAAQQRLRARTCCRLGVLLPLVTSVVAVAIVFSQLFGRDYGMVNWLLGLVGVDPIDWQDQSWSSWIAIATMVDWRWTGYNALISWPPCRPSPGPLRGRRHRRRPAARQFWQITMPMLRPTIIFVVDHLHHRRPAAVHRAGACSTAADDRRRHHRPVPDRGDVHRTSRRSATSSSATRAAAAWLLFVLILIGRAGQLLLFTRRIGGPSDAPSRARRAPSGSDRGGTAALGRRRR